MPRLPKLILLSTILILLSLSIISPGVSAVSTTIGNSDQAGRYPFGFDPSSDSTAYPNFAAGGVYQQVYDKSAFSGPATITQIAFSTKTQPVSPGATVTYNVNIALSTTGAAPNGLSTNLTSNRGADFTTVFAGTHTATITANDQFDVVIDITPFNYNPAQGNLLMEVTFNAPVQLTGVTSLYFNAGVNTKTSRAAKPNTVVSAFTDEFALQTRFTTSGNAQVTLGNLEQTFDGGPKSVAVTTNPANLNVVVTYNGSTTPPVNAGTYAVSATVNDPSFTGQASGNLIINKAGQQIAFDPLPSKMFGDADFNLSANASSNLPVSFTATGNCTVTGTQVHITGAGSCTITASQAGDDNYNASAPVSRSFNIAKAAAVITLGDLAQQFDGAAKSATAATNPAGLNVTLAYSQGGVPVTSPANAGSYEVLAMIDDANYQGSAADTLVIDRATPALTWDNPADITYGTALSAAQLNATASVAGSLTYTPASGELLNAGAGQTLTVNFTPTDAANYNTATKTVKLNVLKARPVVTWANPADITYGTALSAAQLNAAASVAGTLSYTPAAGSVLHAGANQQLRVSFTPDDTNNYESVSANVTLNILKAQLTVRADDLTRPYGMSNPQLTYAMTGFVNNDAQASATSGQPSLTTAAMPASDVGSYPITAAAGTLSADDYSFSFVEGTLTVTKADQTISFAPLANKRYGDAPFALSATVEAGGNAVAFSSQTPAVCLVTGNTVTILAAGTCTIRASQAGSSNHNAAPDVDRSFEIARAVTALTLASSANPSGLGQDVTFTATAASAAGTPTGTVQFIIDGVSQGAPQALNSQGVATLSINSLTAGTHTVTTEYIGDANFATSSGALASDQLVNVATGININDASLTEGDSGTRSFDFIVTLSKPGNLSVQVDFATADGTAKAGTDYQSTTGTLVFAPGEASKTITVPVNGNTTTEPNKTFFVNLSNPQNAAIDDGQGSGTILNDDAPVVELVQNSESFAEGAGHGDITVTRRGDTSLPLTVDYQTSDQSGMTPCQTGHTGLASDRCDYATAAGTLTFAPGEQQKTIPLVLVDDAYMEGPEQLSIRLSNPQGASLGSADSATITITDNDTQLATENPIDNLDFFTRQLYIDFLGREPEAAGFKFWKERMTGNCPAGQTCDRVDTALRFFNSDEFRERGYFVYLFYYAGLERSPAYAEWVREVSKLNGFKSVAEQEAARDDFIQRFMNTQEFMNLYNGAQTGQTFVDALVQKSGVTPASRQQLIDNYPAAGRAKTLRAFMETPEVQAEFVDRAFVSMLYFGFLRRDAEAGGFQFWLQKLNDTNHDYRFMVNGFLQSDERRFRFALIPAQP